MFWPPTLYLVCFYYCFGYFRGKKNICMSFSIIHKYKYWMWLFPSNGILVKQKSSINNKKWEYFKIKTHKNWNNIYKSRLCLKFTVEQERKTERYFALIYYYYAFCVYEHPSHVVLHTHTHAAKKKIWNILACTFSYNYIFYTRTWIISFQHLHRLCSMEWDCIVYVHVHIGWSLPQNKIRYNKEKEQQQWQ